MKLFYTVKELKKLGWTTIGGRVEDYSVCDSLDGIYKDIENIYGKDLVDEVYRAVFVYINYGLEIYYDSTLL